MSSRSSSVRLLLPCVALAICGCASSVVKPTNFSGIYRGNEAESVMLPGERVPEKFTSIIKDDGSTLSFTQSYLDSTGKQVRLEWQGACDGRSRNIEGSALPMQMSCIRGADGASLINRISGDGWAYSETCVFVSPKRLTCSGSMPDASGKMHEFSYVLDRQR